MSEEPPIASKIDTLEKYAAVLRANAEHVNALGAIATETEKRISDSDPFTLWFASAVSAHWLFAKFDAFWFKTATTEAYVRETWPDIPCFSSLDFELLIKHVLYLIEERTYSLTKKSHDEGIDLVFEECLDTHYNAYAKTVVQCKLYRGYVPVTDIRDFFGVMAAHTATGIFFTTGELTAQAEAFIPRANSSPFANRFHIVSKEQMTDFLAIGRELAEKPFDSRTGDDDTDEDLLAEEIVKLQRKGSNLIRKARPSEAQKSLF
jgi:hypothetical protein